MTDKPSTPPTAYAVAAASFLAQALELSDAPEKIAAELIPVREERQTAIYSVELDSSIGAAAFLVYIFLLGEADDTGATGADKFQAGMSALQQAADRDTPGPRMLAHAETDAMGFILATTPATWRALQGEESSTVVATEADLPSIAMSPEQRASVAEDLHRSLKDANDHARRWLAGIGAAGEGPEGGDVTFSEEETALALFVLDNANVQPMLTALNLLVTSAQEQAGRLLGANQDGTPPATSGEDA